MKSIILLIALSFAPVLHADDLLLVANEPTRDELQKLEGFESLPPDAGDYNIHVELQVIALPLEDAMPLIESLKDEKRIEKTVTTLHEMIAKKKARLVDWPMVITKSGQRAVVENNNEVRYPTEFAAAVANAGKKPVPPGIPSLEVINPPVPVNARDAAAAEVKPAAPAEDAGQPQPEIAPASDATPAAFETRNCGVTLEIEPVLDTQTMRLDMQLQATHTTLTGFDKHTVEADGKKTTVEQPRFHASKSTTNLTLHNGQSVLLGTYRAAQPEGWMELHILKLTAKAVK